MVRMANRGLVDFTKARILDYKWWRHYYILQDGMVRDDDLFLIDRQRQHHLSLMSNSNLTDQGFEKHQDGSIQRMYDLIGLVRPWEETDEANRKKAEYQKLKELWENSFGKMDDPETQKNIQAEVDRMKQNAEEAESYVDEEALVQDRLNAYWAEQSKLAQLAQKQKRNGRTR